ncbi:hypothetical protein FQN57_006965 [Myotisia sp. PD_48]|nr:hypothetical protein FQN57_006965 [Myotisia sp. PD_48]
MYGRLPVYRASNIGFCIFSVGCAIVPSIYGLIVFRFLSGAFGSSPLTVGAGSLADMFPQQKRGTMAALWALGPVLGPTIGPIAGGYLSQSGGGGWRWTFWVMALGAGVAIALCFICMSETYGPILIERKTKRLIEETGNSNLRSAFVSGESVTGIWRRSIIRPLVMLLMSPIVFFMSLYAAVVYSYLYLLFTTMPTVFMGIYHFSEGTNFFHTVAEDRIAF